MLSRSDISRTDSDTVTELPVIEFPDHDLGTDLDTAVHPYAAAERVLSAPS